MDALLASIPQLVEAGVTLFISLIENLPTIILEIVKAVPQIIAGIVTAFTESIPKIVEVGANLVRGLWEGIQSLASWLWDKVSGWISSIWDGICNFFGIASPSKEMGWVGEMLVEGLAGSCYSVSHQHGYDAFRAFRCRADVQWTGVQRHHSAHHRRHDLGSDSGGDPVDAECRLCAQSWNGIRSDTT